MYYLQNLHYKYNVKYCVPGCRYLYIYMSSSTSLGCVLKIIQLDDILESSARWFNSNSNTDRLLRNTLYVLNMLKCCMITKY